MTEEKLNIICYLAKRKLTKTVAQLEREYKRMTIFSPNDPKLKETNRILKSWKDMLDILNKE